MLIRTTFICAMLICLSQTALASGYSLSQAKSDAKIILDAGGYFPGYRSMPKTWQKRFDEDLNYCAKKGVYRWEKPCLTLMDAISKSTDKLTPKGYVKNVANALKILREAKAKTSVVDSFGGLTGGQTSAAANGCKPGYKLSGNSEYAACIKN